MVARQEADNIPGGVQHVGQAGGAGWRGDEVREQADVPVGEVEDGVGGVGGEDPAEEFGGHTWHGGGEECGAAGMEIGWGGQGEGDEVAEDVGYFCFRCEVSE